MRLGKSEHYNVREDPCYIINSDSGDVALCGGGRPNGLFFGLCLINHTHKGLKGMFPKLTHAGWERQGNTGGKKKAECKIISKV